MRISDWSSDVCSSDLTQLLVTRLAHIARRPEITSVTRPAAESASERPARYSPEYHRQRIYVDAATLAEMANDEVMLSTGTATSLVVLNGRSEEHTSELQSLMRISYAVFCLKKKK